MSQSKNINRRKILYIALICVFSLVFVGSAVYLISYFVQTGQQSNQYNDLAAIVESIRNDMATDPNATGSGNVDATGGTGSSADLSNILPEYQPMYEINNDLVGWIKIPGSVIDYPVCQNRSEKDYYLRRDFYTKKYVPYSAGCIYVREACDVFTPSDNIVIYGHRMNNGTMFAELLNYRKKDYWESHQTIIFDTIYERHTYQVIAAFVTTANFGEGFPYHQFNDAANEAEFDAFIDTVHELEFYSTGITAEYGDMLITLSTCTHSYEKPENGRFVVVAKRIS